jgi:5-bromo-4-chloroindolyl phosphate hydrolysis protein
MPDTFRNLNSGHRSNRPMAQRFNKNGVLKPFSTGAWLLFILPIPLIPTAIISLMKGDVAHLTISLGAYTAYLYAALLTRQGLKSEAIYIRRNFARPPTFLGKRSAGIIATLSTGLLAYFGAGQDLIMSMVYGLLCGLGYQLVYGFGPRYLHPTTIVRKSDNLEIDEILEQAEAKILAIEHATAQLSSAELIQRLQRITNEAREILQAIAENPRELRRARKFMYVYLDGAQKVSQGYAKTHRHIRSGELEENFRRVLITIENVFTEQHAKLLENDALDLDVQIEVLKTQLENEGVI